MDGVIEGLGVQKILGLYLRERGVIDGKAAKRGQLELMPILSKNWVSYANVVRQGVLALKEIEKGKQPAEPDFMTVYAEIGREKAAKAQAARDAAQASEEAWMTEDGPLIPTVNAKNGETLGGGQGDSGLGEQGSIEKDGELARPKSTSSQIQDSGDSDEGE